MHARSCAASSCAARSCAASLRAHAELLMRPCSHDLMRAPMRPCGATCARMMRSMLADQPNLEVTTMAGESVRRLETTTFSTASPSTCCF